MSVYVDDSRIPAKVGRYEAKWSHLTADTTAELHEFAQRIGLKRSWFQKGKQPWLDHYDVTERMRQKAIDAGAQAITWREAGRMTMARARAEQGLSLPAEPGNPL